MPLYKANITLHQAARADYILLDKELRLNQYSPQLQQLQGKPDENLNNKYFREGSLSLQDVINEVKRAALKTGKRFSFTVQKNRNWGYTK